MNLFELFKYNYGKDLSRITMPVCLNEPLSYVQKQGDMDQMDLLVKANQEADPHMRFAFVGMFQYFIVGRLYSRPTKPFNSLKGETFEYICEDFKLVVEQTSHHPPIHCFFFESEHFTVSGFNYTKLQFNL